MSAQEGGKERSPCSRKERELDGGCVHVGEKGWDGGVIQGKILASLVEEKESRLSVRAAVLRPKKGSGPSWWRGGEERGTMTMFWGACSSRWEEKQKAPTRRKHDSREKKKATFPMPWQRDAGSKSF